MSTPTLLEGGLFVDDRGEIGYINQFDFAGIKRFYSVTNYKSRFVRAWHAHRQESKSIMVVQGAALVGAVEIDDWTKPSPDAKVWRYVLSANKPAVLRIPPGYANGLMSLTENSRIMVFSDATLEESKIDDVRFPANYWDIWTIEER
jgi:dTDP-4-dehydrorhamnose 3,5-epimerase